MKGPIEYQALVNQERILAFGTREQVIDWLCWNDPNGCYTDEDAEAEGYEPLSLEEAGNALQSSRSFATGEQVLPACRICHRWVTVTDVARAAPASPSTWRWSRKGGPGTTSDTPTPPNRPRW